ncbi:sulfonate transport system substrate-binding protein [Saccharothrix saharensis]|uniref:Putative aliphatic sulfonates-binding protein n=1 Tax=Saccharothrix saharensis TaxID=571190 RepID=A0A543JH38_9PSEU|nr:ABC transporter substrate-binding protein [Saccharothrix saharensis]TQM82153.1 sulfonate transport system substrate-binding protein [Saccharothrix saharensis]
MSKLLSAVAVAVLVLAGCGTAGSSDGPVVLKVGDQKGGSKALLTAAGLLDDFPYPIEWSTFTSGPPLLEAASAGAIDVGGVGNTPPIFAAAANAKIAAVYSAKGNVESDALLVPADSALRAVPDLEGRSIAVAKGSSAHGQVLLTLAAAGLTTRDVTLNFLQPSDAYSAFTQKRVDAWAVWDPYTAQAQQEAGARVLTDGRGKSNGYTFQVAGRAALDSPGKSAAVGEFVKRIGQAQRWADTHREEWARVWAAETGLKLEVARAAVERGGDLPVPLDDAVIASEQELADAFTADGALPGKVDFRKFVDTRFQGELS